MSVALLAPRGPIRAAAGQAAARLQARSKWVPAFAGMTEVGGRRQR
ncbi:hypothetical protein GLE_3086 [Lysobacter enzymogenes]|uniref:Uncharacterized protein n=1 Tax=Lysobacter enzymogenes TaxID=69 RepID=A0A0S2DJ50_LYSEN|nr:hypothetical protein GLE_3086 [Lysobacter enzymogenes]